jgi:threonine aldolase
LRIVDLRSDTVTKPSPDMWEAVRGLDDSKLGDDVMGEDPLVNELEEKSARILGKEAALLVTSGSQGNLVSILSHTSPGDEILVEETSHIYEHEVGSTARIGGLMTATYSSERGFPSLDDLQLKIRDREDIHKPWTTLLCAENTHNARGGTVISPDQLKEMNQFARSNDLKFHLDGARIFNAAIALNLSVIDLSKEVDSVMFCLSKGLSCPIGSMVVGSNNFIDKARKFRKMLGGGMRQAGIIAAFGLVALENNWIKRLADDHILARKLADGIKSLNFSVSVLYPETNILMVDFPTNSPMDKIISSLQKEGILAFIDGPMRIRFVTHYGLNEEDINYCIEKIDYVLKKNI